MQASRTELRKSLGWSVEEKGEYLSFLARASRASRISQHRAPYTVLITQAPQCCVGYKNQYRELYSCQDVIYLENVFFYISEDLSEEEKNLPLHKISVIDEGDKRPVSAKSRNGLLCKVCSYKLEHD